MLSRAQKVVIGECVVILGLTVWAGHAARATAGPASPDRSNVLVFSDDGGNAKLALAADPAALMLECSHGSKTVHVTHASTSNPAPVLTIASGDTSQAVKADRQAFEGQTLVLADTSTDAPALNAFRRSGVLRVSYGGSALTAGARPEAFFEACEGRGVSAG